MATMNRTWADSIVRVLYLSRFGPDFPVLILSVSNLSAVRILSGIFEKNAVRCLSVREDKDEAELSGISAIMSADDFFEPNYVRVHYSRRSGPYILP